MISINNRYLFILLIVLVLSINSLFIFQVRKESSNLNNHVAFTVKSLEQNEFHGSYLLKKLFLHKSFSFNDEANIDMQTKNATFGIIEMSHINNHSFNYLINPGERICGKNHGEDLLLIAFVPVALYKFSDRNFVRQTWANFNRLKQMRVVFLTGSSENSTLNNEIKFESELYGDIIQEDFIDTYRNLTLKTIMGLRWVSEYCSKAKFTLKVDDDVVVNPLSLLNYLKDLNETQTSQNNTFMCRVIRQAPVNRTLTSKFYISKREYYQETFPTYCDGPAYMFTTDVAKSFYSLSQNIKQFVFEDVYVGMLASRMNSTFNDLKSNYTKAFKLPKKKTKPVAFDQYFFIYTANDDQYSYVWNHIFKTLKDRLGF